ncbi:hypothetical protein BP5796_12618 [Coleophoma crateriformis]|uniref:Extracellular membrane protein CFEM domain-containing protein n=1 Tax=Coleophoma crateriformis TaxID=565419 RepID=A0A3D8Q7Z2_9HELO|nr:hypothetical protein BP5796_12618 [Coleophoma crateriformis]
MHFIINFIVPLLYISSVQASSPTTYYIDKVPAYSDLPTCAVEPLSSIVRGMVSGCGDGQKYTSYSCFCSSQSSRFNSIIYSKVAQNCSGDTTDASSAADVFHSYCLLGANAAATATAGLNGSVPTSSPSTSGSSQASPAGSSSAPTPTSTITATPPGTTQGSTANAESPSLTFIAIGMAFVYFSLQSLQGHEIDCL